MQCKKCGKTFKRESLLKIHHQLYCPYKNENEEANGGPDTGKYYL